MYFRASASRVACVTSSGIVTILAPVALPRTSRTGRSTVTRPLLEAGTDVFIRFNEGLSILKKVVAVETGTRHSVVLPDGEAVRATGQLYRKPFGLDTTFRGKADKADRRRLVYQKRGYGIHRPRAQSGWVDLIDKWKVFVGRAAPGTGNRDTYPHRIISTPFLGEPGSISSGRTCISARSSPKVKPRASCRTSLVG